VNAPSLEAFKARLDGTFKQPGLEGDVTAYSSGELELDDLKGPFQPKPFYDSLLFFFFLTAQVRKLAVTCQQSQ